MQPPCTRLTAQVKSCSSEAASWKVAFLVGAWHLCRLTSSNLRPQETHKDRQASAP